MVTDQEMRLLRLTWFHPLPNLLELHPFSEISMLHTGVSIPLIATYLFITVNTIRDGSKWTHLLKGKNDSDKLTIWNWWYNIWITLEIVIVIYKYPGVLSLLLTEHARSRGSQQTYTNLKATSIDPHIGIIVLSNVKVQDVSINLLILILSAMVDYLQLSSK